MGTLREWARRLWGTIRHDPTDRELEEELRLHLDLAAEDARRGGDSTQDAARAARLHAGGLSQTMDALRDQRGLPWLGDLARDVRYALRTLRKAPGFTALAIITLALGIGANTVVFTVADALLFRPPPFAHAERLHSIYDVNPTQGFAVTDQTPPSLANFLDWRAETHAFDYMVAWQNWFSSVVGTGGSGMVVEQVRTVSVSPAFFDMLGVHAAFGRVFRPDEEQPGRDRVALLAHGLWTRYFAADPSIVGKTILLDGRPFAVIGVLPADFRFLQSDFELWTPLTIDGEARASRASHSIAVFARVAPGFTVPEAQADLDRVSGSLARTYPATNTGWGAGLRAVFPMNGDLRGALMVLLGAVACVLLIACANVAGLLVIRGLTRQREIAVRAALGASRGRLVRQMLTESACLGSTGAALGVLAAMGTLKAMPSLLPQVTVSRPIALTVDARALWFTLGASVITVLVFGLMPAVRLSGLARSSVSGTFTGRTRIGRVCSIVQIAVSLMLLVGASLLVKTLSQLQRVDAGFHPHDVLTMQMWLPKTRYPTPSDAARAADELLGRLRRLPEVQSAAVVNTRPFQGWRIGATVNVRGDAPHTLDGDPIVGMRVISPDYFTAMGTPVIRGRPFVENDGPTGQPVVLVNEEMARKFWPNADPIGRSIRVHYLGTPSEAPWWPEQMTDAYVIVGVVGNTREVSLSAPLEATLYLSNRQNPSRYLHVIVRTASPLAMANVVQRELHAVDPDLGVYDVRTLDQALSDAVGSPRFDAVLLWSFAMVALGLSAIGVYGVTAHGVNQRRREFAVRAAIGAAPAAIFRMVAAEGLVLALTGIAIGIASALALGRALMSLLYGVAPTDAAILVGAASAVLIVVTIACYLPARRATKVDPMVALRCE